MATQKRGNPWFLNAIDPISFGVIRFADLVQMFREKTMNSWFERANNAENVKDTLKWQKVIEGIANADLIELEELAEPYYSKITGIVAKIKESHAQWRKAQKETAEGATVGKEENKEATVKFLDELDKEVAEILKAVR